MASGAHGRGRTRRAPGVRALRGGVAGRAFSRLTPASTLDVAHEASVRRWSYAFDGALVSLVSSQRLATADAGDGAAAVTMGGELRVALLSSADDRSHDAACRALLAAGATVTTTLRAHDRTTFGERATRLRDARPDLVVVLAGEQRHADDVIALCEALRAGCGARSPAPRILLQGDARTTIRVYAVLAGLAIEVLPDPRREDGRAALVGRAREFRRAARPSVVLRDEALEALARALARVASAPATVVDVSGSSTSVVRAEPAGAVIAAHANGLGVGRAADHVVARAGLDGVRRWIPWAIDAPGLLERVFNRARWPDAVAAHPIPLALEIALAHEAVAHVLADARACGADVDALRSSPLVALTGRVADLPLGAQSLLVAADALRPRVLASVLRDVDDALVALGGIAVAHGEGGEAVVAAEVEARHDPLALFAPLHAARATVRVTCQGATTEWRLERGAFVTVPASGRVDLATSGAGLNGHGIAGPLGLVIDARGDPLALPARDADRIPTVAGWFATLGALPEAAAG